VIKYKILKWSNCFSYGSDNYIDFQEASITQLVGKNGHGKSSIALILEEVLYNKNSKGIKKGAILNRHVKDKAYSISLSLEKDGVDYLIETTRGSTQKVSLYRDGEDISGHTATSTFKDIEELIGYDHKTFSQIVYQSSTTSLEFLTATDTARKKFLIELLNLERYSKALEVVKAEAALVNKELAVVEGKISQSQAWITKFAKEDLVKEELFDVPETPDSLEKELQEVRTLSANIGNENRTRSQNNQYKKVLDSIELLPAPTDKVSQSEIDGLRASIAVANSNIKNTNLNIAKLTKIDAKCPTCGAAFDVDHTHIQESIATERELVQHLQTELLKHESSLGSKLQLQKEIKAADEVASQYEKYHSLYNPNVPSTLLDHEAMEAKILELSTSIKAAKRTIETVIAENTRKSAKNARIDLLVSQRDDMLAESATYKEQQAVLLKRTANLAVLVKAFSTTGLVAYKIECLVKDLEELTNEYLAEMADGRFQLSFQISSADKLNVVITDNGVDVDINALSTGERARVNISTLLAIRKLMQSLSNTQCSLLILDETISNLDDYGKEKLVEMLLEEKNTNTIIVSHDYEHPLVDKLNVIKEKNISRLER